MPTLWQQILRDNFTRWEQLADFLDWDDNMRHLVIVDQSFPLNLPLRLARKIKKNTFNDPILRQFLPTADEKIITPGFDSDPVSDDSFKKTSKFLYKYPGRILLVCTGACAMHCRFCFRRNFDYDNSTKSFADELALIASDPSIHEVILSGGDPLSLTDSTLRPLLQSLNGITHIRRIRFHTRFPIGIPERLDSSFLSLISDLRPKVWFVVHCNHALELDDDVAEALQSVHKTGAVVLNQSVLLQGINDTVEELQNLCERLVDCGIFPYYLHQLDRVQGSAHFEVTESRGQQLIAALTSQLSGYAVPKYVREVAGMNNKLRL